jgi:putative inorganic carbon (HCO3(-)) transporter
MATCFKRLKITGREVLDLLIEFTYLAVIFFIPLSFSFWFPTYNIFELNKIVLFKILIWFLLFLTVIKIIFYFSVPVFLERKKIILSWLKKYYLIPFIFIIGLSFSLFFSTDVKQSFFGSYDRQQGLVSYFFYFLWFVLLSFNILTINNRLLKKDQADSLAKRINRIIKTIAAAGLIVSLYGILQILNIDFLTWPEPPFLTHRTFSSFGQPNFLASWLLLIIPLNFYLIVRETKSWGRIFYSFSALAALFCLLFTSSRGALVALVLVVFIFLIYLLWFTSLERFKKILIVILFFIILGGSLVSLELFLPGRLASFSDYQTGSLAARFNFYAAASDATLKKPLFGYGLENSDEVFIKYYEPNWGLYGAVNASADRAHNLLLDILITSGFWGLFFFALLYAYFFKLVLVNLRSAKNKSLALALALAAAGYLLSLLFSFAIVAGEAYFWLFLALLTGLNFSHSDHFEVLFEKRRQTKKALKIGLGLIAGLIIIWQIRGDFKILIADQYFNKLFYALAQDEYFTVLVLDDYIRASKPNPVNQTFYNQFLGDKLSDFYFLSDELTVRAMMRERLKTIFNSLPETGYENLLVKGKISSLLGRGHDSEQYFARLNDYAPHWPKGYLEEARSLKTANKLGAAENAFRLAAINLPSLNDSRLADDKRELVLNYLYVINKNLGDIYFQDKNYDLAEKYYQLAYVDNPTDFTLLKNIADTYYLRGDLGKALEYTKRGAKRNPRDYNWFVALASLAKEKGEFVQASAYLDQALKLAPNNEELKKLWPEYNSAALNH